MPFTYIFFIIFDLNICIFFIQIWGRISRSQMEQPTDSIGQWSPTLRYD